MSEIKVCLSCMKKRAWKWGKCPDCLGLNNHAVDIINDKDKKIAELEAKLAKMTEYRDIACADLMLAEKQLADAREALIPFAHDDLQVALGGNAQGDLSIVYARNKAVLTLGDFRRAKQALKGGKG